MTKLKVLIVVWWEKISDKEWGGEDNLIKARFLKDKIFLSYVKTLRVVESFVSKKLPNTLSHSKSSNYF